MKDECIKCQGNIHISNEAIEKDIKRVINSGVPVTNNEQYEKRLKTCNRCDQMLDGTTCMICGCIVRVRALNALRICPHYSGSKW